MEKLIKRGVKTHKKCPKRTAKLSNEEVTKGTKWIIFQGKKFLKGKLQKKKLPWCHISMVDGTQDEQFSPRGGETVVNFMISEEKLVCKTVIVHVLTKWLKQSLFIGSKVQKNRQVEIVGRNLLTKLKLNLFN